MIFLMIVVFIGVGLVFHNQETIVDNQKELDRKLDVIRSKLKELK